MKRVFILAAAMVCVAAFGQRTEKGAVVTSGGIRTEVSFFAPQIVRVQKTPEGKTIDKQSFSVILSPEKTDFSFQENSKEVRLTSSNLKVTISKSTGAVSFSSTNGKLLTKEVGSPVFEAITGNADAGSTSCQMSFSLEKDEAIYGFGILQNGQLSQRGQKYNLLPGNTDDGITLYQSVKGYGIFWDNYSPTHFSDTETQLTLASEVGNLADYYLIYGGNLDATTAGIRQLTGDVPMFPLWTYGFWQSKERYKSQDETVGVLRKYRELQVPIDGMVQDWQYWGNNYLWNAMEFLNADFQQPKKMMDDIHNMNAHLMISIWSSFGSMTKPYRELDSLGLLFNFDTWPQSGLEFWPPRKDYPSGVRVYDAYSSVARDIYWKNLRRLEAFGIEGWWMDSTEPDHFDWKPEDWDTKTALGTFRSVRSAYPLLTVGGVYDHQRAESARRVFILTRSGFVGQQRYGCNVWSGDVGSSWASLRCQIPAGLNFTLTGNPNFNSDIGGFFCNLYNSRSGAGDAPQNPSFQELYVRWAQMAVFTPMMRSHGADAGREIYQFGKKGEPIYDAIEAAIRLRYKLLPYIYSTSWQVTNARQSFMRPLAADFAADKQTWNINNEYLFGKSLLVAPVQQAQYTPEVYSRTNETTGWDRSETAERTGNVDFTALKSTKVYLPKGANWYDYSTKKRYTGGQTIEIPTTIATTPVFVREGSIIVEGPDVQYATEKSWTELNVTVYAGANAEFVLYEDEGDNYNYEKGAYLTTKLVWNEKTQKLTMEKPVGEYVGMIENRTFNVKVVDKNGEREYKL